MGSCLHVACWEDFLIPNTIHARNTIRTRHRVRAELDLEPSFAIDRSESLESRPPSRI